jgi:NitT/TauT family transport system ATP-binding protein
VVAGTVEPAISLRAIAKTFDGEVKALEDISFDVRRHEFVSVLGPSGCGKSTLLRIIGGLYPADPGGTVEVRGDFGLVFQTHNMLPWLSTEANIRLAAEVRGMARAEIDVRTEQVLQVLRLEPFRTRYPHQLSGGMRQRAAFGQILILQPQVLLLDEPFGALDALTRDQLNIELLRLWEAQRQTVLLVTHSIPEAVFLSDRVLVMSDRPGRIIDDVAISLPRPRDPQSTKALPQFARHVLDLSRMMGVV